MTRQSILIWAALLITLGLSWHTYQQDKSHKNDTEVVLLTRVLSLQQIQQQLSEPIINNAQPLRLTARQSMQSEVDLFAVPKQVVQVTAKKII